MMSGPPCQEYWRADAVFAGLVDEIADMRDRKTDEDAWPTRIVQLLSRIGFSGSRGIAD